MLKKTILYIFTAKLVCATVLSGSVEHLTLTPDKNPYIIEDNLTIKENGLLTIEKGCTLLFKPFTGIVVDGSLIVEGTLEEPVVFTTINDNKFNKESTVFANPFDWNGILINEKASKVKLTNFVLTYSVYGVRSMKEELTITNGSFKNNGQFHMTVKDDIKPVADGIPYSYKNGKISSPNAGDNHNKSKLPLALAISGLVCGGGSGVSAIIFSHSRKNYPEISASDKRQRTNNVIKGTFVSTIACGTAVIVLLPAALIIHKNNNTDDQQKNVMLVPVYNKEGPGIVAHILF